MVETDFVAVRDRIVDYLTHELVGPVGEEEESLRESPTRRYSAGILYPQDTSLESETSQSIEDASDQSGEAVASTTGEDQSDQPVEMANQLLPSSLGLSFMLRGAIEVEVDIAAAAYTREGASVRSGGDAGAGEEQSQKSGGWTRQVLSRPNEGRHVMLRPGPDGRSARVSVLDDRASLRGVWREVPSGFLITISLVNERTGSHGDAINPADCLFQVQLICRPGTGGRFVALPRTSLLTSDIEEHELELLYRHNLTFANGHGCAVKWTAGERADDVEELCTAIVPQFSVPAITYERESLGDVLLMSLLANGGSSDSDMVAALRDFASQYGAWIKGLRDENPDIAPHLEHVRDSLLARLNRVHGRISEGIDLLEDDAVVRRAFRLANRAMLLQTALASDEYAGEQREAGTYDYVPPDLEKWADRRWRPFQLAFLLLTLPSLADGNHPDRELVDLIWFPTGGGKTEAYLAVTAFVIFFRRLRYPRDAGGTTAIMRYTLRMLTAQQFRRAAGMLAACELIRRDHPTELTDHEISIGLWVGSDIRYFSQALPKLQELLEKTDPENPFQIEACPVCGTRLIPLQKSERRRDYGIEAGETFHYLRCPNDTCPFADHLPIYVVDEQIYATLPTLLLATVDKFANLPWRSDVGKFFGGNGNRPPDLVIQDELHLISGPLGTIVGLYETAIDGLVSLRGPAPKIIASTATIRQSGAQVRSLYARDVSLFPPAGLTADDSWFARRDPARPGRLYVGVLAPAQTGSTAYVRTASALLQAPRELNLHDAERDAYWTLVSYFNSLRELGKAVTFAADDIPARMKVIAADQRRVRNIAPGAEELTSNVQSNWLVRLLSRLERSWDEDGAVSLLLCSNMLSVGVDISRLALMLVAGQPKTTSEYIQATSRVGRGTVPGLVVCLYSPTKPRDRSHYERFTSYHSALYRGVEPTSATPFTLQARERALHAVLVSLIRHGLHLEAPAALEPDDPEVAQLIQFIVERVRRVDHREADETEEALRSLLAVWLDRAEADRHLQYQPDGKGVPALLKDFSQVKRKGWPTLRSMRNVDANSTVEILGTPR